MPLRLKWTVASMASRFPAAIGSDAMAAIAAIREKERSSIMGWFSSHECGDRRLRNSPRRAVAVSTSHCS